MKTKIQNYTFNKTARTITFPDYGSIRLDSILTVLNTTSNVFIYNPAVSGLGGTVATNVLTFAFDSSAMSNSDDLLIYYDDAIEAATDAKLDTAITNLGALIETAPATDTASSGLNGRLQRVAQRITSLIALLPTALGQGTMATSLKVVLPSDQASIPVAATLSAETTKIIGTARLDQSTNGTTNAVYVLESADVIDLVLSTDTSAYALGDVLADTQEVTGVTRLNAGTAELRSLKITDKADQGQAMDIVFLKSNVSLGTENSTVSISDADAVEILGIVNVYASDFIDLGGVRVATATVPQIMLKAGSSTTSIYVAAISRGTGTYGASDISMKIGILRM